MNKNDLLQAIADFNNGYNNYNQGNIYCFLYKNTWYPLRALINYASGLSGENVQYTKDRALVKLHELMHYVKVEQVEINHDGLPVLSKDEIIEETNNLAKMITDLTQ